MNYNPYALTGKTILITGASSGIGRATAIECAKLNATCVLCGRNELRLQETLRLLEGTGHIAISADLLKEEGIHAIVEQTPNLDGVVCNAGVNMMAPIYFIRSEEIDKVLRTNTIAPMTLVNALLRNKRIKNQSSLVFTSSLDAVNPDVGSSVYAASKAALSSFMRSCAKELAPRKIRANAIQPGLVETGMMHNGLVSEEDLERHKEFYLLKRYARPEEIAWSIIYLLSDASNFVTGSVLTIDGGASII
ncbi:MAG: SDR family oxidoreductase [Bacteroidales bacterium]|nr:SDR family oxidoreductase [Bacteroidales bacterium]